MNDFGETPLPIDEYVTPRRDDDNHQFWRVASLAGFIPYVVNSLFHAQYELGSAQIIILLIVGIVAAATLAALVILFQPACKLMTQRLDLLIPVGIVYGLDSSIGLLSMIPGLGALLTDGTAAAFLSISFTLSCSTLFYVAIWICYAAWQTDLIHQALTTDGPLLLDPMDSIRRHWLRVFVVLFIGVKVLMVGMIPILGMFAFAMPLALILIAALGVSWNIMTAALLPTVMFSNSSVIDSIKEGLRNSWQNIGRWWIQLGAQLVLLGIFVLIAGRFSTTTRTVDPNTGQVNVQSRSKSTTSFQVNALWVGGYEHNTRWYSYPRKQLEVGLIPLVGEGIGVLMLVLAIAMKITVIRELYGEVSQPLYEDAAFESPMFAE